MENTEGSEGNTTKNSDSAYSNSCGNSQSQRSSSSKSRHSGSNSSGSSGYGGKALSTVTDSNEATSQPILKRIKDKKIKKTKTQGVLITSSGSPELTSGSSKTDDENAIPLADTEQNSLLIKNNDSENISLNEDCSIDENNGITNKKHLSESTSLLLLMVQTDSSNAVSKHEIDDLGQDILSPLIVASEGPTSVYYGKSRCTTPLGQVISNDGFSCVVSMGEGVVLYTNVTITTSLGYPQDMWLGKSFLDFIHPKDRPVFAQQISSGVTNYVESSVVLKAGTISRSTVYCRMRNYRGLKINEAGSTNYGVREREVTYNPFQLNLTFRDASEFGDDNMYLVVKAVPVTSPYSANGEIKTTKFTTRHTPTGIINHAEPVAHLGYLPQDIVGRNMFDFYHPEDMPYLKEVYDTITKSEKPFRSKPYRFCTQNGDYLTIESDWSTFINPWSRKLELIICCHHIIQGPLNTNVFQTNKTKHIKMFSEDVLKESKRIQAEIIKSLSEFLHKKPDSAKLSVSTRCKDLATFMERLVYECERSEDELHIEVADETSLSGRDSVMLGEISPHHDYYDSKSSTGTPPSYNQLNYNENLQRFFESRPFTTSIENTEKNSSESENSRVCIIPDTGRSDESGCSINSLEKMSLSTPLNNSKNTVNTSEDIVFDNLRNTHLTEDILHKHNSVMEKLMVKNYRDARSVSKAEEREKRSDHKNNQNQANASQGTAGCSQGVKRSRSFTWKVQNNQNKFKKLSPPDNADIATNVIPISSNSAANYVIPSTSNPPINKTPPFVPVSHPPADLWPPFSVTNSIPRPTQPLFATLVQYMMYPPTMYPPQPFLYAPHVAMTYQPVTLSTSPLIPPNSSNMPITSTSSLGLPFDNFQQACQVPVKTSTTKTIPNIVTQKIDQPDFSDTSTMVQTGSASITSSVNKKLVKPITPKKEIVVGVSHPPGDDMDIEASSFSSFYSSFLKTGTSYSIGSIDSGEEPRNTNLSKNSESISNDSKSCITLDDQNSKGSISNLPPKKVEKSENSSKSGSDNCFSKKPKPVRDLQPPWLESVCVTSDLVYRYQLATKSVEEVLKSDLDSLNTLNQPSLVNEQLSQLYMDLELEGLPDKLTLEEGLTSTSSSEEDINEPNKIRRRFSRLVMIYEEDAPIPPPLV